VRLQRQLHSEPQHYPYASSSSFDLPWAFVVLPAAVDHFCLSAAIAKDIIPFTRNFPVSIHCASTFLLASFKVFPLCKHFSAATLWFIWGEFCFAQIDFCELWRWLWFFRVFSSARPILQIPAIDLRKDFVQSMALGIFMRWPDNRDWCISPHLYYIRDLHFAHLFLLPDLRLFGRQKPLHIL